MRKFLTMLSAAMLILFSYASGAFAETLNDATIKQIHNEVKTILAAKCIKDMKGGTDAICSCLGDKAQQSLNDAALAKCTNDEKGGPCISNAVKEATEKALAKENILACKKQSAGQTISTNNNNNITNEIQPAKKVN